MSNTHTILAEIRNDSGKGASRRLRRIGKVPAVLYGGDKEPVTLSLNHKDVSRDSESESFYSSIMDIKIEDGRTQQVVVRDLQRHPFKQRILHVDFMRVSATEILKISVPLHFVGADESPAGKASGVVIQHQMTEVEIAALPKDLPEYIEVDLSDMEIGQAVVLADIKIPEGVEILQLQVEGGADIMIANSVHISEDQGTGAAAAADAEAQAAADLEAGIAPAIDDTEDEDAEPGEDGEEAEGEDDSQE
jgi:large subunit ribosomal protein L25